MAVKTPTMAQQVVHKACLLLKVLWHMELIGIDRISKFGLHLAPSAQSVR
jgi:hypothetical protein